MDKLLSTLKKFVCAALVCAFPVLCMGQDAEFDSDEETWFVVDHLKFAPSTDASQLIVALAGFGEAEEEEAEEPEGDEEGEDEEGEDEEWNEEEEEEEEEYVAYGDTATVLTVPSTVTYKGKTYTVTYIAPGAFMESGLQYVTVPSSVTQIGMAAFCASSMKVAVLQSLQLTIESYAFSAGMQELHLSATVPPVLQSYLFLNIDSPLDFSIPNVKIYVPAGSLDAYLSNDKWAAYNVLEEGQTDAPTDVTATVDVARAGTLKELIRQQVPNYRTIARLTVSGIMNDADFCFVRDSLPRLKCVDITDVLISELPSKAFYDSGIETAKLPVTLKSIGKEAFSYCSKLDTVVMHEGLVSIGESAFSLCSSITYLSIPSTVQSMGQYTLMQYHSGEDEPHTVTVECNAFYPPRASYGTFYFIGCDAHIKVPAITADYYREARGWNDYPLETFDVLPQGITLTEPRELDTDKLPQDFKPALNFSCVSESNGPYGALTLKGGGQFNTSSTRLYANLYYDRNYHDNAASALYLNAPYSTDELTVEFTAMAGDWYFLSFPFDVKLSDVKTSSNVRNWVVRSYSSQSRANGYASQWTDVPAGGTLEANRGYIWFFATDIKANDYGYGKMVQVMVQADAQALAKTAMFSTEDLTVPLQTYAGTYPHNSNWNLVGNPYPTYFDVSCLDQTMPVIIYNERWDSYQAYSPVDDELILRPGQPMFLQKPDGATALKFKAEGRQTDDEKHKAGGDNPGGGDNPSGGDDTGDVIIVAGAPMRAGVQSRQIFNFTIESEDFMDKTRVVLNEDASVSYETKNDALKFFSPNEEVLQLYTLIDGVPCSINERAMADGKVVMGVKAGRTEACTLTLGRTGESVILEDHSTGAVVDLNESSYTFTPQAGRDDNRFTLRFGETTLVESVSEAESQSGIGFDIMGRRVENPSEKGLYIRDGKKFIIK